MIIENILLSLVDGIIGNLIEKSNLVANAKKLLKKDPQRIAFKIALAKSFRNFQFQYPELVDSLFDEHFLQHTAAPLLARMAESGQPVTPAELTAVWAKQFGNEESKHNKSSTELQEPFKYFLNSFDRELRNREELQFIFNRNSTDKLAEAAASTAQSVQKITNELNQILGKLARMPSVHINGDALFTILMTPPLSLVDHLRTGAFKTLVNDRTRDFVGRDFMLKRIEAAFADPQFPSGYVLIQGEPGIGKTSFMAELVKRWGAVHHFNISLQDINTAEEFLGNICSQLIIRYGLDYESLPRYATLNGSFLMQILEEVARLSVGDPILILVDALDEASDRGVSASANCLFLPRTLPDHVYFIVTARPIDQLRLVVDRLESIPIADQDPQNLADARTFIQRFIDANTEVMSQRIREWGMPADEFAQTMVDKSDGNFMYLKLVLQDILKGKLTSSNLDNIQTLPQGLNQYYESHWRLMGQDEERFENFAVPVIGCLAVVKNTIGVNDLAKWTGISLFQVSQVISEWRQFLETDDQEQWRIYHPSFQRFLSHTLKLDTYRQSIIDSYFNQLPGGAGEKPA